MAVPARLVLHTHRDERRYSKGNELPPRQTVPPGRRAPAPRRITPAALRATLLVLVAAESGALLLVLVLQLEVLLVY